MPLFSGGRGSGGFSLYLNIRHFLFFNLCFLICANSFAQQYPFVYYTPKDGLINSRVRSIKQDSKGRMYFITYGGLSVYDGVKFENYNQQDGLGNELLNDLIEISPDSFLVASNTGILNTLVRGKIGIIRTTDGVSPVINRFHRSKDGFLYVLADEGLFKLTGNTFIKIPLIDHQGKDLGTNLDRITEWEQYLFISPWNFPQIEQLIIYDQERQKIIGALTGKGSISTAIVSGKEVWMSSNDGLEQLDLNSLQKGIVKLNPITTFENALSQQSAVIYSDHHKGFWILQGDGVLYRSPSGKHQTFTTAQGLKTSNLSDIFMDREGMIWMASDGNGVVKLPGTNVQILGDLKPGVKNSFPVLYHQSDTTWLFNKTDNSFYQIYNSQLTTFSLGKVIVPAVIMAIQGETLYYIANSKLYAIENKNKPSSYLHPQLIHLYAEPSIELGANLSTPDGFIIQYVRETQTSYYLVVLKNKELQMRQYLSSAMDQMALDKNGILWLTTRDNKLMAYSLHPETPGQYIQQEYNYAKEIEGFGPRSITVDTTGNVWIGTRYNGVYRLHFEDGQLKTSLHLTTDQGLTDNFHYYLYCDRDNNIWVGSQTGLDKISFKNGQYIIENVTKSKNIFQGIYNIINAEKDVIWALTSNGQIIKISETNSVEISPKPSFFITSLMVNDSVYEESSTIFTHTQNNFSIRVAAPSFTDEKSILYSYRLTGSGNPNWSEPSNNADFNFINLAPGNYQLTIKADYPAALYPSQNLVYSFKIKPPYWRTLWFRILVGISVIFLFSLIARYFSLRRLERQRIKLESKQAMEKERTRIATDMHDDLGAGLTRIKFLSETIGIKKQLHLPVEEEIQNIRTHAHDMIDKMGEIVWALNEKNDSLSDLLAYTREYAVEYLSENGLKNVVNIPDDFPTLSVSGEFRRNVYLSVKEALHNIIKHAQANQVVIDFIITSALVIRIHDDGIGFDATKIRPYSNGLVNMKKRMSDIGGNIAIKHEHGTTIILSAPLAS